MSSLADESSSDIVETDEEINEISSMELLKKLIPSNKKESRTYKNDTFSLTGKILMRV